jgi:hypothetical protein
VTAAWQRVLADAMRAADPVAAVRAASEDDHHPASLRRALQQALRNEAGLRMTALLVAKLRFERLVRGSGEAAALFDRHPRAFTEAFRRYHAETPARATFPAAEARDFAAFCKRARISLAP